LPLADHPEFARLLKTIRSSSPAIPWKGRCYRLAAEEWARSKDLFNGEGARKIGGRWNRPGITAVYASLDVPTVTHEWLAQMKRAGIPPEQGMPFVVGWGEARLRRVLDVGDASLLRQLEITRRALLEVEWTEENRRGREALPQALGRAALRCGYEGLLVPSAVVKARNLVLFPQNLGVGSRLKAHGLKGFARPTSGGA
jgi:RES domain-containing protein